MTIELRPGSAVPVGATFMADGVNFSVYANKADAVELVLFDSADDAQPMVLRLDAS